MSSSSSKKRKLSWQSYLKYVADDTTTGITNLPSVLEQKLGDADVFALTPKWVQELILSAIHGNDNVRLIKEIMSSVDLVYSEHYKTTVDKLLL